MQLHFKDFGQGEPLVMLHGLFGSSDNWLGVAKSLAGKFHVYLVDLRNHGQSGHSDEMDYPLMANDVAEFLEERKLENVNLLGHSLGGKVAMQFALNFPDRLKKLVVVDMAPRVYAPEHEPIFRALLALDLEQFESRTQIEEALAPKIPSLALRRFLLKNITRSADGDFMWKMNLRSLADNYLDLGKPIFATTPFPKPALFIRGGKSDYISDADVSEILKLFPGANIQTIAGANHWVHADAPDQFIRLVSEFLSN